MSSRSTCLALLLFLLPPGQPRAEQQALPIIPLCPGLKIVTAISQAAGDYESIKRVTAVSPDGISLHYSSESMIDDPFSNTPPQLKSTQATRNVLARDQADARFYLAVFAENLPESLPGSTALGPSRAIYEALKQSGKAEISLVTLLNDSATSQDLGNPDSPFYWSKAPSVYMLEWTDRQQVALPVLVNGRQRQLPALKVNGTFGSEKAEFFILDDPRNPLALKFRLGLGHNDAMNEMLAADEKLAADPLLKDLLTKAFKGEERDRLQVTQISYDCAGDGGLELAPGSGDLPEGAGELKGDVGQFPSGDGLFGSEGAGGASEAGAGEGAGGEGAEGAGGATGAGDGAGGMGASGAADSVDAAGAASGDRAKQLEKALAEGEKVDIYDIFFSFNSATLRPESDDVLGVISGLLAKHPDWNLVIGGHTDSIASDSFNLDLSQRRAAAVKDALVSGHKIDAARLSSQGHGEGSPRGPNDTPEGRALNRRVELMRSVSPA